MTSGFLIRVPLVDGDFLCNALVTCLISFCLYRYHNTKQLRKAEVVSSNARCTYKSFYYHWLSLGLVVALVFVGFEIP